MSAADPTPVDDVQALHVTARSLGISEHQVFVEAYRAWYGNDPAPPEIDRLFARRLYRQAVPIFVRHFVRDYLERHPEALHAHSVEDRSAHRARWLAYILIILMVIAALLASP